MSVEFDSIIKNDIWLYLNTVERECKNLMEFCNSKFQESLFDKKGLLKFISENKITEVRTETGVYKFHGSGCSLFYSNEIKLQWDFGYENWWCGIDPFFTYSYLKYNRELEYSIDDLKMYCEESVEKGLFYKLYSKYYIFLYKISSIPINIPNMYDTLVVSYRGKKKKISRNKLTDRFARKATCCYSEIEKLDNNYELFFYNDGEMIYTVYYNSIAYPLNAVEIMSKQILNSLNKETNE